MVFLQNLAQEKKQGKWVVNHGMLQTLVSSYGYLLHNFYPPENRRAIIFYDHTTEWKAGGNGKSIVANSSKHIKPWHFVGMKKEQSLLTYLEEQGVQIVDQSRPTFVIPIKE